MLPPTCGRYAGMAAKIIDGKAVAEKVHRETGEAVVRFKEKGITPGLAVVLVGDDPASRSYVRSKAKTCERLGVNSFKHELPASTSQEELIALVEKLNGSRAVHGILVQSPPPAHIDEAAVVDVIDPAKDVDGFHAVNVGKLAQGDPSGFVPCTPLGCQRLLLESGIDPEGKHLVVIGRSMIVGKPFAMLMMQKARGANATVTVAHSRTVDLEGIASSADILVAAIGSAAFVKGSHVGEGAVVLDVVVNRVEDPTAKRGYRLVGDVAFEEAAERASAITPVPGGVGPMTIAMLLSNTIKACRQQTGEA